MQQHPGTAQRCRAGALHGRGEPRSAIGRRRHRARPDPGATLRRPSASAAPPGSVETTRSALQRDRVDVEIGDRAGRCRALVLWPRAARRAARSRTSVVQRATPSSTSAASTACAVPPAPSTVADRTRAGARARSRRCRRRRCCRRSSRRPRVAASVLPAPDRGGERSHLVRDLEHGVLERHRAREAGPVGAFGEHGGQLVDAAVDRLVRQFSPSASYAALCSTGDSECATGRPSTARTARWISHSPSGS